MMYCGARTRRGSLCERKARMNGRCNLHGGKSLAWFAHPRYKHGHYSKYGVEAAKHRAEQKHAARLRRFQRELERRNVDSDAEVVRLWRAVLALSDLRLRLTI